MKSTPCSAPPVFSPSASSFPPSRSLSRRDHHREYPRNLFQATLSTLISFHRTCESFLRSDAPHRHPCCSLICCDLSLFLRSFLLLSLCVVLRSLPVCLPQFSLSTFPLLLLRRILSRPRSRHPRSACPPGLPPTSIPVGKKKKKKIVGLVSRGHGSVRCPCLRFSRVFMYVFVFLWLRARLVCSFETSLFLWTPLPYSLSSSTSSSLCGCSFPLYLLRLPASPRSSGAPSCSSLSKTPLPYSFLRQRPRSLSSSLPQTRGRSSSYHPLCFCLGSSGNRLSSLLSGKKESPSCSSSSRRHRNQWSVPTPSRSLFSPCPSSSSRSAAKTSFLCLLLGHAKKDTSLASSFLARPHLTFFSSVKMKNQSDTHKKQTSILSFLTRGGGGCRVPSRKSQEGERKASAKPEDASLLQQSPAAREKDGSLCLLAARKKEERKRGTVAFPPSHQQDDDPEEDSIQSPKKKRLKCNDIKTGDLEASRFPPERGGRGQPGGEGGQDRGGTKSVDVGLGWRPECYDGGDSVSAEGRKEKESQGKEEEAEGLLARQADDVLRRERLNETTADDDEFMEEEKKKKNGREETKKNPEGSVATGEAGQETDRTSTGQPNGEEKEAGESRGRGRRGLSLTSSASREKESQLGKVVDTERSSKGEKKEEKMDAVTAGKEKERGGLPKAAQGSEKEKSDHSAKNVKNVGASDREGKDEAEEANGRDYDSISEAAESDRESIDSEISTSQTQHEKNPPKKVSANSLEGRRALEALRRKKKREELRKGKGGGKTGLVFLPGEEEEEEEETREKLFSSSSSSEEEEEDSSSSSPAHLLDGRIAAEDTQGERREQGDSGGKTSRKQFSSSSSSVAQGSDDMPAVAEEDEDGRDSKKKKTTKKKRVIEDAVSLLGKKTPKKGEGEGEEERKKRLVKKKGSGGGGGVEEEQQLKTGTLFACRVSNKDASSDLSSPLFSPSALDLKRLTSSSFSSSPGSSQPRSTAFTPSQSSPSGLSPAPPILFEVLVDAFDKIEQAKASGTGSNKKQTVILTNLFRILIYYAPSVLVKAVYICLNKVAPDYLGKEVGVGESLILKAMAETYGRTEANLKKELQHVEDLGRIAEQSSCTTRTLFPPPRLTIEGVYDLFLGISQCSGRESVFQKRNLLKRLLVGAKGPEPKYIIRFLQQRMRTGASHATVYQALAFAFFLTRNAQGPACPAVADTRRKSPRTSEAQTPSDLNDGGKTEAGSFSSTTVPDPAAKKSSSPPREDTKEGVHAEEAACGVPSSPVSSSLSRQAENSVNLTEDSGGPPSSSSSASSSLLDSSSSNKKKKRQEVVSEMTPVELEHELSSMEQSVRRALCEVPNLEIVISYLLQGCSGETLNKVCVVTPGIPIQPMLARPTRGFAEVLDRLKEVEAFTCEYKYDGERIQLHLLKKERLDSLQQSEGSAPQTSQRANPPHARLHLFSSSLSSSGKSTMKNIASGGSRDQHSRASSLVSSLSVASASSSSSSSGKIFTTEASKLVRRDLGSMRKSSTLADGLTKKKINTSAANSLPTSLTSPSVLTTLLLRSQQNAKDRLTSTGNSDSEKAAGELSSALSSLRGGGEEASGEKDPKEKSEATGELKREGEKEEEEADKEEEEKKKKKNEEAERIQAERGVGEENEAKEQRQRRGGEEEEYSKKNDINCEKGELSEVRPEDEENEEGRKNCRMQVHAAVVEESLPGGSPSSSSSLSVLTVERPQASVPPQSRRPSSSSLGPPGVDRVRLFSRNLEEITGKYPDVIDMFVRCLRPDVEECILDGEVVAYDEENKRILPFQTLTRRKRKDVLKKNIEVPVAVFIFDCMRLNGECQLNQNLETRRKRALQAVDFSRHPRMLQATHREVHDSQEFEEFLNEAVQNNCEGLMVKTLRENATYEPSKRSLNWLKVKKDYVEGLTDSVDLVPIGAFYGKGKRTGTFGTYLLAVYNPADETFQTVCKAATGFSEEALEQHRKFLSNQIISHRKPYYQVDEKMTPDVWFEASQVWECRAADLSISPVHTAALGERAPDKGIGLRFPRFLRIREDKNPEQATTSAQIVEMYDNQFRQTKDSSSRVAKQDRGSLVLKEDEDDNEEELQVLDSGSEAEGKQDDEDVDDGES